MLTIEFIHNCRVHYFEAKGRKPEFIKMSWNEKPVLRASLIAEVPQQRFLPFYFIWGMHISISELPDDVIWLSDEPLFKNKIAYKQNLNTD